MNTLKKIIAWLADPKIWFLIPMIVVAFASTVGAMMIMTRADLADYKVLGYVLLAVMVVTLSYSVYGVVRVFPKAKEFVLAWSEKYPRINRAFNTYGFTTLVFTAGSLLITLAFAVYNGAIAFGIVTSPELDPSISIWFFALMAYYIVLVILRGSILIYHGRRRRAVSNGQTKTETLINDGKLYRTIGIFMFLLPVCLSFAIMQMVRVGDSFEHPGITIYIYAIYVVFKVTTAVYSFVRERHNHLMTIMATTNIQLADALVSILALQTAMFREFGMGTDNFFSAMNIATGAVVCVLTVAIGVYMIVRANIRLKRFGQQDSGEEYIEEEEIVDSEEMY